MSCKEKTSDTTIDHSFWNYKRVTCGRLVDHYEADQVINKISSQDDERENYGGWCVCPSGGLYMAKQKIPKVAANYIECANLDCEGGKKVRCEATRGDWSNQVVKCGRSLNSQTFQYNQELLAKNNQLDLNELLGFTPQTFEVYNNTAQTTEEPEDEEEKESEDVNDNTAQTTEEPEDEEEKESEDVNDNKSETDGDQNENATVLERNQNENEDKEERPAYQPLPPTCTLDNNSWASCNRDTAGSEQICSGKSHMEYECCNPMTSSNQYIQRSPEQVGSQVGKCLCPNGVEQPAGSLKDNSHSFGCNNGIACYGGEVTDTCQFRGENFKGVNMEVTCNTAPHQTICDKFGKVIVPTSESTPTEWNYTTTTPLEDSGNWISGDFDDSLWGVGSGMFGTYETAWARIGTVWDTENIYMRKEFTLQNVPAFFSVRILYNENAKVYINGIKVHDSEDQGNGQTGATGKYVSFFSINASEILNSGKNMLAIHCTQPQNTKENKPPYKYKGMSLNQFLNERDISFPDELNYEQQVCDAGLIAHAESYSHCHSYDNDICQCFPEFVQPTNPNGSCEVKADHLQGCQEVNPDTNKCRMSKKGWLLGIYASDVSEISECPIEGCEICQNGVHVDGKARIKCLVCAKGYLKKYETINIHDDRLECIIDDDIVSHAIAYGHNEAQLLHPMVGIEGGICTCPDGSSYPAGFLKNDSSNDKCSVLACEGGDYDRTEPCMEDAIFGENVESNYDEKITFFSVINNFFFF